MSIVLHFVMNKSIGQTDVCQQSYQRSPSETLSVCTRFHGQNQSKFCLWSTVHVYSAVKKHSGEFRGST